MKRYVLTPSAKRDVNDIWNYIAYDNIRRRRCSVPEPYELRSMAESTPCKPFQDPLPAQTQEGRPCRGRLPNY
jgi:hypothetical protein